MTFADGGVFRHVVKKDSAKGYRVGDSTTLCPVHAWVRQFSTALKSALPEIRPTGPKNEWVYMDFIEGVSLEELMTSPNPAVSPKDVLQALHRRCRPCTR